MTYNFFEPTIKPAPKKATKTTTKPRPSRVIRQPTQVPQETIPEMSDVLDYCLTHYDTDVDCAQYYRMVAPAADVFTKTGQPKIGGKWSGPAKATLTVLRKMQKNPLSKKNDAIQVESGSSEEAE